MPHRPRAVIYIPPLPDLPRWLTVCADYVRRHEYELISVCQSWQDVVTAVLDEHVGVIVAACRGHLPPDREPRVEVVADVTPAVVVSVMQRRSRRRRQRRAARR